MTKLFSFLALSVFVLNSCGDAQEDLSKKVAVGGAVYGGELRMMSQEKLENLFPLGVADIYSVRVTSQIFETILKLDPSGTKVIPGIAESFTASGDAKSFTLKIRKGVYFHADDCFGGEGRELTAEDVKFVLDFSCSGIKQNSISWFLRDKIVGGKEFFAKSKTTLPAGGVKGITVIDAQTLKIELVNAFGGFDKLLTHPSLGIFPKEAYDKYGAEITKHPVGTGPFSMDEWTAEKIRLKRNDKYWKQDDLGNQLPFLGGITITYSTNKRSELLAFRNKEIDLVSEIPVEEIENILGTLQEAQEGKNVKHKVINQISMSINYFGFAHSSPIFANIQVRKAFNLAVDRKALVDTWLEGEGYASENGFVPSIDGYPSESVRGFNYDPAQAKTLMAAAGYANGVGFPEMKFYVNGKKGSGTYKMAEGVIDFLQKNLGIKIKMELTSLANRDKAIATGTAMFWRSGWVADYPDPENFLGLFYGGNIREGGTSMNPFKYKNPAFDKLFEQAMRETDYSKRMKLYAQCDQIVIDDAVVMPLLTDDFIVMYNSKIRKFETNCMEQIDFSTIFIKEIKE